MTVPNGEGLVCTITSNDQAGTLKDSQEGHQRQRRTKTVSNSAWPPAGTLVFDAGTLVGSRTKTYTAAALTVNARCCAFDEIDVDGYTEGTWSCTGASSDRDGLQPS